MAQDRDERSAAGPRPRETDRVPLVTKRIWTLIAVMGALVLALVVIASRSPSAVSAAKDPDAPALRTAATAASSTSTTTTGGARTTLATGNTSGGTATLGGANAGPTTQPSTTSAASAITPPLRGTSATTLPPAPTATAAPTTVATSRRSTHPETAGGAAHTWTDYTSAGGTQGPTIAASQTVQISCKVTGFRVADGNTWWYRIGESPWNGDFFVSADAFYNNGATSGLLSGTPFVDNDVPNC